MLDHVIAFALRRPALAVTIGVSVVLSLGLVIHFSLENAFATDFSVYWRTANEPVAEAYRPRSSLPFPYPPTMLVWIKPLAVLPMWVAFALWVGASIAAIVAICRNFLSGPAIGLLLISPPLVNGLSTGQVSAALTALLIWACMTPHRLLAGLAFGVIASVKPQLVVMAPLLLLLRRDWPAVAGAAVAFLAVVASTVLLFGPGIWLEWLQSMENFRAVLVKDNVLGVAITPAAAASHLRLPPLPFLVAGAAAGLWLIVRCRNVGPLETATAIAAASLLAAPYALTYDLAAIAPFLIFAAFQDRKEAPVAIAGILNPLPLLLTGKLLSDQATAKAGRTGLEAVRPA